MLEFITLSNKNATQHFFCQLVDNPSIVDVDVDVDVDDELYFLTKSLLFIYV